MPAPKHQCCGVGGEQPHGVDHQAVSVTGHLDRYPVYDHSYTQAPDFISDYLAPLIGALWHLGVVCEGAADGLSTFTGRKFQADWTDCAHFDEADVFQASEAQSTGAGCCMDSIAPVEPLACVTAAESNTSVSDFSIGIGEDGCSAQSSPRQMYIADAESDAVQLAAGDRRFCPFLSSCPSSVPPSPCSKPSPFCQGSAFLHYDHM